MKNSFQLRWRQCVNGGLTFSDSSSPSTKSSILLRFLTSLHFPSNSAASADRFSIADIFDCNFRLFFYFQMEITRERNRRRENETHKNSEKCTKVFATLQQRYIIYWGQNQKHKKCANEKICIKKPWNIDFTRSAEI